MNGRAPDSDRSTYQRKNGRTHAESHAKAKDCKDAEARIFRQNSYRNAGVTEPMFEPWDATTVAVSLFRLIEAAEFNQGKAARFFGRHAGADTIVDMKLEM